MCLQLWQGKRKWGDGEDTDNLRKYLCYDDVWGKRDKQVRIDRVEACVIPHAAGHLKRGKFTRKTYMSVTCSCRHGEVCHFG